MFATAGRIATGGRAFSLSISLIPICLRLPLHRRLHQPLQMQNTKKKKEKWFDVHEMTRGHYHREASQRRNKCNFN